MLGKKIRYLFTNKKNTLTQPIYFEKIRIGSSAVPFSLTYDKRAALSMYFTCPSVNTGTNFEPVKINTVMTGAGQVGGRVRINLETNVQLGGWANAFKASIDWKTNGAVTGLGSVACLEATMQGAAFTRGTYTLLEFSLACPTSWSGANNNKVSLMYANVTGTTKGHFDDFGYLFQLMGVGVASGHLFQVNTAGSATHALRINIAGTNYYIMLTDTGA